MRLFASIALGLLTAAAPTPSHGAGPTPGVHADARDARTFSGRRAGVWALGWSGRPRWQLPRTPQQDCPGQRLGPRTLRAADRVRCPDPAAPTAPEVGAKREQLPPWAILGRGNDLGRPAPRANPPPSAPRPPATLDANAIMRLAPAECLARLDAANVEYTRVMADRAPEVAQPIRPLVLGGVRFEIPWSKDLSSDRHAIWDCRLAVAMLPLAQWLRRRGVDEVHYFSALRAGASARKKPRSQHNRGLALDVLGLVIGQADRIDVEDHYPRRKLTRCPVGESRARRGLTQPERLFMNLVCEAYGLRLVHTLLTPDHDRAHANHLHLDIKPDMRHPVDPFVSFAGRRD